MNQISCSFLLNKRTKSTSFFPSLRYMKPFYRCLCVCACICIFSSFQTNWLNWFKFKTQTNLRNSETKFKIEWNWTVYFKMVAVQRYSLCCFFFWLMQKLNAQKTLHQKDLQWRFVFKIFCTSNLQTHSRVKCWSILFL